MLLENTTYWPDINGFRTSNSPLLSDEVRDLDFDENKKFLGIKTFIIVFMWGIHNWRGRRIERG